MKPLSSIEGFRMYKTISQENSTSTSEVQAGMISTFSPICPFKHFSNTSVYFLGAILSPSRPSHRPLHLLPRHRDNALVAAREDGAREGTVPEARESHQWHPGEQLPITAHNSQRFLIAKLCTCGRMIRDNPEP